MWRPAAWMYLGVLAVYGAAAVAVAVRLAAGHGWRHLPILPVVFAFLHVAWGTGFHAGIWHWWVQGKDTQSR